MSRHAYGGGGGVIDFGLGGGEKPPRDVLGLLAVLFVTYTLSYLPPTQPLMGFLRLSPDILGSGYLWQLVTYAFVPVAGPIWFLVSMLIILMFARDVYRMLGRRRFWRMLFTAILSASGVAVVTQALIGLLGIGPGRFPPFILLNGDEILLTTLIAAFATLYPNAVIRLFFVIPVRAASFLWLEILVAFVVGFLPTQDFAGFLGICTAVGVTYASLTGGVRRSLREMRLRMERRWIEWKLRRMRRKSGIRLVKPDEGGDARRSADDDHPWVH